ncbi:MAG: hypothetical protein EOP18_12490, partial [Rhizobiaceae bacterium]
MRQLGGNLRVTTLCLLAGIGLTASSPLPASAFEIFGWKLFGGEENVAAVSDPVKFTLTFNGGGDKELAGKLEEASALAQEKG